MNNNKQITFVFNKSSVYYHVKELKLRACYLGLSFLLTFFICYYYSFEILYLFVKPFLNYEKNFIFTDLTEAFYTTIQLNLVVSMYILVPFIIYNIWCFFIPSTFLEERQKYNFFFSAIVTLLVISACFIFFLVLPELYKFLLNFEINDKLDPQAIRQEIFNRALEKVRLKSDEALGITTPENIRHLMTPKQVVFNDETTNNKEVFDKINNHLGEIKSKNQLPPLNFTTTEEQQDAGAPATYSVPITFNESDFFV